MKPLKNIAIAYANKNAESRVPNRWAAFSSVPSTNKCFNYMGDSLDLRTYQTAPNPSIDSRLRINTVLMRRGACCFACFGAGRFSRLILVFAINGSTCTRCRLGLRRLIDSCNRVVCLIIGWLCVWIFFVVLTINLDWFVNVDSICRLLIAGRGRRTARRVWGCSFCRKRGIIRVDDD